MQFPLIAAASVVAALGVALVGDEPQRIHLTVERQDAAAKTTAWVMMNPATVFNASDRIRFRVRTTFSGYLYVMNKGTAGTYETLFPRPDTGSHKCIDAGTGVVGPAGPRWVQPHGA